jgi:hypothetical protein
VLAYVFWHWRRPEVEPAAYARLLAAFHQALGAHPPPGFIGSVAFRGADVAWSPARETYEDWYLTDGSRALDPLNEGAVSGACRAPHDDAARAAQGGLAGLYRLRRGSGDLAGAGWSSWFSKPGRLPYAALDRALDPLAGRPGIGLWARQMALGPAPEFCLMAPAPVELPAGIPGFGRALERLWSAG